MENTTTIEQVVEQVIKTIAVIGPIAASVTYGLTELLKKFKLASRWIGIGALVLGFLITILLFKVFTGVWFSPLAILVGVVVAFATPGAYSVSKNTFETKATV